MSKRFLSFHDLPCSRPHVTGVISDSRKVCAGSIFVAVKGHTVDGHQFILSAQAQGALVIVGQDDPPLGLKIPYLQVSDSALALAHLSADFYGHPSASMLMIGVTGTSGKTTTTYLIESILKAAGHQVGVLGTVNFRYGSTLIPSTHTTPGPVELQALLAQMKAAGCTAIVMEVSSHALKQKRAHGVAFDGMVFTNLSPEHLDFHPDMEDYYQSKALLFTDLSAFSVHQGKSPVAAINASDPSGSRLISELTSHSKSNSDLSVASFSGSQGFKVSLSGIQGELLGVSIHSEMTGNFNAANLAAALTVTQGLGISPSVIAQGIRDLKSVPGRLERVGDQTDIHVWVDYAHKPDALEKVIATLQDVRAGHRLITVFGCGGDRDRKKRPLMGKIAVAGSDWVVVTSDNPRTEDPQAIIQEILQGIQEASHYEVEVDRKKAIFKAIAMAQPGDLVLIAGKGHEDYQILGTTKIHFDDREEAALALKSRELRL
jgi:UDP-N-acetylmuramoyl-L-alanyl-D-glutamate--2,6-diaminopimelate ligase